MTFKTQMLRLVLPCLLLGLTMASVASADEVEVRRLAQTYFAGESGKVEIDLAAGSVVIEGTDDRNAEVELILSCTRADLDKCRRRANRVQLKPRISRGVLHIKLKRTPRAATQGITAELRVRIPHALELEVDVKAGNVEVSGMTGSMEIDAAAGDVEVLHQQDLVGLVKAAVGLGDATLFLRQGQVDASGFPRSVKWQGTGSREIEIDLGGGKAVVRLE